MFSVNIDKLINMTKEEAKSYEDIADAVILKCESGCHSLAVAGIGLSAFKLASAVVRKGKKVLFVDADFDRDIFISKYRLGKDISGIADYIFSDAEFKNIVCNTNIDTFKVVFTGNISDKDESDISLRRVETFIDETRDYDLVIIWTDEKNTMAQCCDETLAIVGESQIKGDAETELSKLTKRLTKNGCNVWGVVVDECN